MAAVAAKVEKTLLLLLFLLLLLRSAISDVVDGVADNDDGLVNAATGVTARAQRIVAEENFMIAIVRSEIRILSRCCRNGFVLKTCL